MGACLGARLHLSVRVLVRVRESVRVRMCVRAHACTNLLYVRVQVRICCRPMTNCSGMGAVTT